MGAPRCSPVPQFPLAHGRGASERRRGMFGGFLGYFWVVAPSSPNPTVRKSHSRVLPTNRFPRAPVPVNLFSIGSNQLNPVLAKGKSAPVIGENKSLGRGAVLPGSPGCGCVALRGRGQRGQRARNPLFPASIPVGPLRSAGNGVLGSSRLSSFASPCLPCQLLARHARGEGDASLPVPTVGSIPSIPSSTSPSPAPTGAVITARCALIAPFQLIKPGGDPNYDPLSCQAPYF